MQYQVFIITWALYLFEPFKITYQHGGMIEKELKLFLLFEISIYLS